MHRPATLSPSTATDSFITTTDHWHSWKHAKEHTTAGISGLHFGMFKAQIHDPDLSMYDGVRCSIPYQHGLYCDHWLKGVDVMLLQATGNTCSDKLCTILLMEADFNMNNKKLSCNGMQLAESHACIAPEQAGGCNRHTSSESLPNSHLIYNDSRFQRKAMAICSNNAKGCFNRIVHSIAYLCL